jgi:flagellin
MDMRINNNLMAMNTHRQLGINSNAGAKSIEKLSSGFRINRAGDDAAGLAISEKMRAQVRGLSQASRNAQDGISLIQTAEGAMNETHAILQRMRELAVQSANDTNVNTDRGYLQDEIAQLSSEIDEISTRTEFNTRKLLNGNLGGAVDQDIAQTTTLAVQGVAKVSTSGAAAGDYTITSTAAGTIRVADTAGKSVVLTSAATGAQTVNISEFGLSIETTNNLEGISTLASTIVVTSGAATFHIGANQGQTISLSINQMDAASLGINTASVSTQANADDAIDKFNSALDSVSQERAKLGAVQNRLEHTIKSLDTSAENLQASESRIRDVDMAKEMMEFTKNNILQQAAQAMLAQANQAPQGVLQLLR